MKILYLTSRLPYPPTRGDRLRTYNFLKILSKDHDIDLVTFVESSSELKYLSHIEPFCKNIETVKHSKLKSVITTGLNIWRKLPLQTLYYKSGQAQKVIDQKLASENYDAIIVHLFRMVQFVEKSDVYKIVDFTDVISAEIKRSLSFRKGISKIIYNLEYKRIGAYEKEASLACDECWFISDNDANLMRQFSPKAKIHTVGMEAGTESLNSLHPPSGYKIAFLGNMKVYHNIDAALFLANEVLPIIQQTIPDAELLIIGADPTEDILKLNAQPNITVTGFVEDLNVALNEGSVFVAPLRFSAGTQTKVLAAMATGRPVVTTKNVANGLGAVHEEHCLIAETAENIAAATIRFLENKEERISFGLRGQALVNNNWTWNALFDRMKAIETKLKS